MQDKNKGLERVISEILQEKINQFPSPPLSTQDSWEQFQNRQERSKSPRFHPKARIFAASVLFIISSLIFFSPQSGSAFQRLTEMFHTIQGTAAQLFVKVGDRIEGKDAPGSGEISIVEGYEVTSENMSLDEARQETAFEIILPDVIPVSAVLQEVLVIKSSEEKSNEIYLIYEGEQTTFTINEKRIEEQFGMGISVDREDTKIEELTINGRQASLLLYKNGVNQLFWTTPEFYYSIEGKLSKEEIIGIAKSM
ncbi:hypothetical protein BEP19_12255 [Ammoniphilus oxalaticus]|uniref:DUF4367 domain-containing protein n=1 Tax=Ammoniphilus oxalaticus TaxID=66863 RepID=A0A419SGT2_9BACL|nr:DUF4367 domain-containing protein [Ammoniphilus oxalaticus]RKD22997.1 hypothetical protein BEP19_12255 [Ammoniphilus oxalaticus]